MAAFMHDCRASEKESGGCDVSINSQVSWTRNNAEVFRYVGAPLDLQMVQSIGTTRSINEPVPSADLPQPWTPSIPDAATTARMHRNRKSDKARKRTSGCDKVLERHGVMMGPVAILADVGSNDMPFSFPAEPFGEKVSRCWTSTNLTC